MRPDDTPLKTCTKCGVEKPATTEFFGPRPERPCGLRADCRECERARGRARQQSMRSEKTKAEMDRREAAKASRTKVCKECGQELPATTAHFAPETRGIHGVKSVCRECKKAYFRAYNAEHAERRNAQNRQWYADHMEEQSEYRRRYYEENREHMLASHREWARRNPDITRACGAARDARLRNAPGSHTSGDVTAQRARQKGRCFWCGEKTGRHYHVDHVVPLKLGGSNGPENIVIACASCNQHKSAKHPMDWAGCLL